MLRKTLLLLIFCFILFTCIDNSMQQSNKFLLKLTPEQVMKTFDDVMSDDYIKVLAKQFAAKAAAHFMNEINKQKQVLNQQLIKEQQEQQEQQQQESNEYERPQARKTKEDELRVVSEMVQAAKEAATEAVKSELDENEALRLIQEPSPDGDHLDSSGEISHEEHKKIPIIQVTKINGIYFRRLLGMI